MYIESNANAEHIVSNQNPLLWYSRPVSPNHASVTNTEHTSITEFPHPNPLSRTGTAVQVF